jgi:hypothetical protein
MSGGGVGSGSNVTSSKLYIVYAKRRYKVFFEKCRKFIVVKRQRVYLGTIRGKYVYV